jgi:hypothetical protein
MMDDCKLDLEEETEGLVYIQPGQPVRMLPGDEPLAQQVCSVHNSVNRIPVQVIEGQGYALLPHLNN